MTVPHLFVDILALNLHQLGILRECDEVVLECAGVALGIVDTKRQRHSGGDGISTTVHGAGAINDDQSVLTASEILLCLPCCVNGLALLIGDIAATEEGLDHLIGRQGASVELLRTLGDTAHEFIIAVSIISHEGLTILEHGLGGLLGVIEGVVFFAQVVLDDADLGAQGAQRFAVLGVVHTHHTGNSLRLPDHIFVGGIDGGEPLGQQGHGLAGLQSGKVSCQLFFDQLQHLAFAGGAHQGQ